MPEQEKVLDEKTISFLKRVYREYYFRHSHDVEFPTEIGEREFGYIPFGGGMIRHLAFATPGAVTVELLRQSPSSVYCSNARYSNPSMQMEEKGWKGAELIFDIDADTIPSGCKSKHNRWYCASCNKSGRSPKPSQCPDCNSTITELAWVCGECLRLTKEHLYRLLSFLTEDFGVSIKDVRSYFSGNRGYHVHVYDPRFEQLEPPARAEVANYIKGMGMSFQKYLTPGFASARGEGPGWGGRITKTIFSTSSVRKTPSRRILLEAVQKNAALIDQSVTMDVHRIFRMAGTLHGNSGMLKKRVHDIEGFDPLVDPVVLGDEEVQVFIGFCPRFEMKDLGFGPFKSETRKVPTYAAVYMLTKGLARCE